MVGRTLLNLLKITGLSLAFYQLARFEFLIWNWSYLHQESFLQIGSAWLHGLRFDLAGAFAVSSPFILLCFLIWGPFRQWGAGFVLWTATLMHSLFLVLSLIDVEFIHFLGRRSTADTLLVWQEIPGKMGGFLATYWHLYLVNTFLFLFFWYVVYRLVLKRQGPEVSGAKQVLISFLVIILSVVTIRGGLQKKPLSFVNANLFANFYLNNLVLNSSFTFAKSLKSSGVQKVDFFVGQEEAYRQSQGTLAESPVFGQLKGASVVLIILESFGSEYTKESGKVSYTPFLDSLKEKSLAFPRAYASGRRSIEGIASLLTGLPVLMGEPFITSKYASQPLFGLPEVLKKKARYQSQFFHGGLNGTMHFDAFAASIGFDSYFGFNEYGQKDFDGTWGAWDRPFFQRTVQEIAKMQKPFFVTLFSLSSHHPFRVPEHEALEFPEGPLPILKSVRYSDSALKDFFEKASQQEWFEDTLFILTADHTSTHYLPDFSNLIGSYEVPLILFHPRVDLKKYQHTEVVSHVDVMPTVLDLLGVELDQSLPFGTSLFRRGPRVSSHFLDGQYILFTKEHYLTVTDWERPKIFSTTDRQGVQPLAWGPQYQELLERLKAQVQFFNNGLEENQLYLQTKSF